MKKISTLGLGAIGSAAIALTLGGGVAWADDDVVGQTYKEAKAALGQQGFTAVVATTVGDRKEQDDCLVTSASKAPAVDGYGNDAAKRMLVNLNCYATYSTSNQPGFSVQDPEVADAYKRDMETKKQQEAAEAAKQEKEAAQAAAQ